ncbi:hypothetical protein PGT21_032824 [Puccinia graminis f. sp. tritici]|uniref:Uncharacterized protein n=1 Tax=Puccinia graminis f. sp. tritici TaxID=56615 RepID=A0A5B0NEL6_PUCGR|nr:hypothetical protein PGT21_032824 [Puccinia graminis f. sp. tritici]KAA1086368.1 hypothetical protein PGTUg99_019568 [Puccinia graminis f. sp. tritici]
MVSSDVNSDSLHQSHLSHLFSVTSSSSKIDKPTSSASNPFNFQLSRYCLSNRTMNSTITQSLPSLILLMLISCGFTLCQVGTGYDAMCEKHNPPMAPYCFDYYKASGTFPSTARTADWEFSRGRPLFACPIGQWTLCCVRKNGHALLKTCDNAPKAQGT